MSVEPLHPAPEELYAYRDGELPAERRRAFELVRKGRGRMTTLTLAERAELARLRTENIELRMQRDVLKRSVALWVNEAMGR